MSSPTVTQETARAAVPDPVWDRGKLFIEPDWPLDDAQDDDGEAAEW